MNRKKTKKTSYKWVVLALIAMLVLGVSGVGLASAKDGEFSKWFFGLVAKESAKEVVKKIEIPPAELLEPFGEILGGTGETPAHQTVTGLYDLTLKDSDSSEDTMWWQKQVIYDTIGTSSSTFLSFKNTTDNPIYVKSALVQIFGTASATVHLTMGTSSPTVPGLDWNTTGQPTQIFGYRTATNADPTMVATGTSGSYLMNVSADGVSDTTTTLFAPWVVVKPNEYILGMQQADDPNVAVTSSDTSASMSRGYHANSFYLLELYRLATST